MMNKIIKDNDQIHLVFRKLNIDWIRHAESCSNYDQGHVDDKQPPEWFKYSNLGYKQKNKEEYNTAVNDNVIGDTRNTTDITKTAAWKYHPNLSFIGMQHAIILGLRYTRMQQYNIILSSATLRTVMTALLSFRHNPNTKIYVCPYVTEFLNMSASNDNQNNPIESSRLKRFVKFIKEWLRENWLKYYDDIEINEKLKLLRDNLTEKDTLYLEIDNLLNCKINIVKKQGYPISRDYGGDKCLRDYTNIFSECSKRYEEGLKNNEENYEMYKFFSDLGKNVARFVEGPTVDFSILEHFENNDKSSFETTKQTYQKNLYKFYHNVLPYLNKRGFFPPGQNLNICVFSHGNFMRTFLSFKYGKERPDHLMNTSVYAEDIYIDNSFEHFVFRDVNITKYVPPKLRTEYENFSALNLDVCRIQSVKGVINYPLWSKDIQYNKKLTAYGDTSRVTQWRTWVFGAMNEDVKIAWTESTNMFGLKTYPFDYNKYYDANYDKEKKNESFKSEDKKKKEIEDNVLLGGSNKYHKKYLKYKLKYKKLKDNI